MLAPPRETEYAFFQIFPTSRQGGANPYPNGTGASASLEKVDLGIGVREETFGKTQCQVSVGGTQNLEARVSYALNQPLKKD